MELLMVTGSKFLPWDESEGVVEKDVKERKG